MGFRGYVDERAFLGAFVEVLAVLSVDPAAGDPTGGFGVACPVAVGAIRFDRRPV
jgi:hypothetical protein